MPKRDKTDQFAPLFCGYYQQTSVSKKEFLRGLRAFPFRILFTLLTKADAFCLIYHIYCTERQNGTQYFVKIAEKRSLFYEKVYSFHRCGSHSSCRGNILLLMRLRAPRKERIRHNRFPLGIRCCSHRRLHQKDRHDPGRVRGSFGFSERHCRWR